MSEGRRTGEGLPGTATSLWLDTTPETSFPVQDGTDSVDVAVVGGGIAGLLTAYRLKQAGLSVAVIEARRIVHGVTGNTTAKLTAQHNLIYSRLLRSFGEEQTRAYAQANQQAITTVRDLASEHGIDCDFQEADACVYTTDPAELSSFEAEVSACQRVGLPASLVTEAPVPFNVAAAALMRDQARFHPRKFLLGLSELIPGDGSHVFERTRVVRIEDGEPCTVTTEWGTVRAGKVVVASHYPLGDRGTYTLRLKPKRTPVLGVLTQRPVPEGLERSLLISIEPMYSLRTHPWRGQQMLLVGGKAHKTGQADTVRLYIELEQWAREQFGPLQVIYRWSTQDNVTPDGVPYTGRAGRAPGNIYVTTGYGGWGMTNAVVSAGLLHDLITGGDNELARMYAPGRIKLDGLGQIMREGLDSTAHLIGDRFNSVRPEDIPPGSGGVIKEGVKPVALYRAEDGTEHRRSAICTHLGCVVAWNEAEKSWDCPCHGSRFSARGRMLQTPAIEDLAEINEDS